MATPLERKKTQELIRKIAATGREARSYSGRFMYGRYCVGVALEQYDSGSDLPLKKSQRRDSLGMGQIVYWPHLEWPTE